jgi:putative ABC transport system substrate-binding protein
VGVLYNPAENQEKIDYANKVAQTLGLRLLARPVSTPQSLPDALNSLVNDVDVLWGLTDQTVLSPQTAEPILLFSFRHRIPFIGLSSSWVKAGALYALDRDYTDLGVQCGEIANKMLQGVRAESVLPVTPRKVLYTVNLKTAQHMKVEIAPPVLNAAQQAFQ